MKREFKPEKASKAQLKAASMPLLKHMVEEPFYVTKSEVVHWLVQQPEILQSLFNHYKDSGSIVFDQEAKAWKGVNAQ